MPCYRPLHGYRSRELTEKGKRKIVFNPSDGYLDMEITIPCGQCIGCRLEKSRQWAIRCVYEAQMYDSNCFITLTYDNEHLPKDHSLKLEHFQKFFKLLRKRFKGEKSIFDESRGKHIRPIRYFHCGEYGDEYSRPHYHACVFNFDFPDKELWKTTNGVNLYTSEICNSIWKKGYCVIGDVTFDSAAYVARYITKKLNNDDEAYTRINFIDGEIFPVKPEYATMSRNGGIGKEWFKRFKDDVYPHDYVVVNGKKMKPPKFFDKLLEEVDHFEYHRVKDARKDVSEDFIKENETYRLLAREKFKKLQLNQTLPRRFENE